MTDTSPGTSRPRARTARIARQDPIFRRSLGAELGRDGCRVPIPWSGSASPYGFRPASSTPWLPQPEGWAELTVQAQRADPSSTLQLYRTALRLRRELDALGDGELLWRSEPGDDVLCFGRPGRGDAPEVVCIVNLGSAPTPLPGTPALASGPLTADGLLPPDTAAWLTGEASHRGTS